MDIFELENFNLADAVKFHKELNPKLWQGQKMQSNVQTALLRIARDFREFMGITDIALQDITVSGSNAAYSYTDHSDIDLHLIVDMSQLDPSEVFKELFDAKKYQYNDQHNIKIHGYDVELYVQPMDEPHVSSGEYSVLNNKWIRIPTQKRANINDMATRSKYEKLGYVINDAIVSDDINKVLATIKTVKKYRRAGLDKHGELGPENLAYKMLRTQGTIQKLFDRLNELQDAELSLESKHSKHKSRKKSKYGQFGGIWYPGYSYNQDDSAADGGLGESLLDEVRMGPSDFSRWIGTDAAKNVLIGFELELIFRETMSMDDREDGDYEDDMSIDTLAPDTLQEVFDFFESEYSSGSEIRHFRVLLTDEYEQWVQEQVDRNWDIEKVDYISNVVRKEFHGTPEEIDTAIEMALGDPNDRFYQIAWDQAYDDMLRSGEHDFFRENYRYMSDIASSFSIPWPARTYLTSAEDEWGEIANELSGVVGMPFAVSTSYHGLERNNEDWILEPDVSISPKYGSDAGIEIISPPIPLQQGLAKFERLVDYIKSRYLAYTNDSTGLHINLSLTNKAATDVDYTKLILFLGDKHILSQFDRESNMYAKSALDMIRYHVDRMNQPDKELEFATLMTMFNKIKQGMMNRAGEYIRHGVGKSAKYTSVNDTGTYFEFRAPGGDYLGSDRTTSDLINTAIRFAKVLDIAADPEAHKQEYTKKLYKMLTPASNTVVDKHTGKSKYQPISSTDDLNYLRALFAEFASSGYTNSQALKDQWAQWVVHRGLKSKGRPDLNWEVFDTSDPDRSVIGTVKANDLHGAINQLHDKFKDHPNFKDLDVRSEQFPGYTGPKTSDLVKNPTGREKLAQKWY